MPGIPAPRRLNQEDVEFEAYLGYTKSLSLDLKIQPQKHRPEQCGKSKAKTHFTFAFFLNFSPQLFSVCLYVYDRGRKYMCV